MKKLLFCLPIVVLLSLATMSPSLAADNFGFGPGAPPAFQAWPMCSGADDQYCIESASFDGQPVASPNTVSVSILGNDPTAVSSFNWAIQHPGNGPMWALDKAADTQIVVRVGTFTPRYTSAYSDGLDIQTQTDPTSGNTTMTISGRSTSAAWTNGDGVSCGLLGCGDNSTIANQQGIVFSGNTQDMGGDGWAGDRARFQGMYIAGNAQTMAPTVGYSTYPEKAWTFQLANPHLISEGTQASGTLTAYLPANYFSESGIDPEATQFQVTRTDDGQTGDVAGTTTLDEAGGAKLRIDNLTYSSPSLRVKSVPAPPTSVAIHLAGTGGGTVTSSPGLAPCSIASCSYLVSPLVNLTLYAEPNINSTFVGWSGSCSGVLSCKPNLSTPVNATATFTHNPVNITLSVSGSGTGNLASSPAGINCHPGPTGVCGAGFTYNTSVVLTPKADRGSKFMGWSGACAGARSSCSLVTDQPRLAGARFIKIPARPSVRWSLNKKRRTLVATITRSPGTTYTAVAAYRTRKFQARCRTSEARIICSWKLPKGRWAASVVAKKDGVSGAAASYQARL